MQHNLNLRPILPRPLTPPPKPIPVHVLHRHLGNRLHIRGVLAGPYCVLGGVSYLVGAVEGDFGSAGHSGELEDCCDSGGNGWVEESVEECWAEAC